MPATSIATSHGLSQTQWLSDIFKEYRDRLLMKPYMGTSAASVIQVKENLMKMRGDTIVCGLAQGLDGAGVSGNSQLEGNEEAMSFYSQSIAINQYRNAVLLDGIMDQQRVAFNLRNEARDALAIWMAQETEDRIVKEFSSIDGTDYPAATEAGKDSWLASNSDRVLFGAATSNNSSNDHSASLANVDSTTDVLTPATVSLLRRLARLADPKIRPFKLEGGVEMYVLFVHPYAFRDLAGHATITAAQRESWPRLANEHPIFKGQASIFYDGVLVVESEKVLLLDNVGASSIDVAANCLCGAQAIIYAQGGYPGGQRLKWVERDFDYDEKTGFAVGQINGIEAAMFNSKLHGQVRYYSAAVAD